MEVLLVGCVLFAPECYVLEYDRRFYSDLYRNIGIE
jgi:hypothetical protein